jgi:predicted nucleic acid-binding protein
MTTFFDTNVLVSVLNEEERHHGWAVKQLEERKAIGPAIISDIVYCEFSIGMENQDAVDAAVYTLGLERYQCPDAALFRAGIAFKLYKRNRGTKSNVLPDFIIGASAEVEGVPLVTANVSDFRTYFPTLKLITP